MRGTSSPAAKRWRVIAMTWRLAAAFCSSAQVGELVQAGAQLGAGHDRVGAAAVAAGGLAVGAHQHC
jgi:hypothetical protein